MPLVLAGAEWEAVESGLVQRAELLDAILRDVYGPRKLVREGVVARPVPLVPSRLPTALRGRPGGPHPYAALLFRRFGPGTADGSFHVVSDRGQNPSGYGYALENRAALGRALPSLFRQAGVHRLEGFFQSLRRGLAEAAPPDARDPFMVCSRPAPITKPIPSKRISQVTWGIPLVRGGDLVPGTAASISLP